MVPCGTVTASPPSSRVCETKLSRRVRVSSLDLGVPWGRERLTSREAMSSPDETPRGKHSAGTTAYELRIWGERSQPCLSLFPFQANFNSPWAAALTQQQGRQSQKERGTLATSFF